MAVSWNVVVAGQSPWASEFKQISQTPNGTTGVSGKGSSYRTTAIYSTVSASASGASGATDDGANYYSSQSYSVGTGLTSSSSSGLYSLVVAGVSRNLTRMNTFANAAGTTTGSTTGTPSVYSQAYVSGTGAIGIVGNRNQSTTQTTTRSIITKHSDSNLSSTTTTSQVYTKTALTYTTSNITISDILTGSYIPGSNHLRHVWQAGQNQYLRPVTATVSALTGLSEILGDATMELTQSSAVGQYSYGVAIGAAFTTFTTSYVGAVEVATTLTVASYTYTPVTLGASDGWIGGAGTTQEYVSGLFTATQEYSAPLQMSTYATGTVAARLTYAATSVVSMSYIFSDTIAGINATGGSTTHLVEHLAPTVSTFSTTLFMAGDAGTAESASFGYSATVFTSPSAFVDFGTPLVTLNRLERAFGYQHASNLGAVGGRGASVTANSSFFIGTNNYVMADPNEVRVPVPFASTASTADSSYSFSQGSAGQWFVTALRTDTSISTITTFTASVGTQGAAEVFINQGANWWPSDVLGGANALTGINQKLTFGEFGGGKAAGWKYTIRDSSSTTAYTTHLEAYTTATIGTNIIALETFSSAPPHMSQAVGSPMNFLILPFNQ